MVKKVVIIGFGISGKEVVAALGKAKDVELTVVAGNTFVEWALGMTYVLARPDKHSKLLSPNPAKFELPGAKYKYGVVSGLDAAGKQVKFQDGSALPYDVLVVATGYHIPLVYPQLGATLDQRKAEVASAADAIKKAGTVVIVGGGPVGLELAGDIRVTNQNKKIVVATRDGILKTFPERVRVKVEQALKDLKIDVLTGAIEAPQEATLTPGSIKVGGTPVAYDVLLPAYATHANTGFLSGTAGLLDARGRVQVNGFLQNEQYPEIFTIGVASVDEFASVMKIKGQAATVINNIKAFVAGKPLKQHKEAMPEIKNPPFVKVGHGKGGWGHFDIPALPPPVKCCCCGGLGGFPFCPPPCCWACCNPCCCGYCCGASAGQGPAVCGEKLVFMFAGSNYKGMGEAPKQQSM